MQISASEPLVQSPTQRTTTQKIFWIDLFCGAGGTSTGIHLAGSNVLACVNHDKNAIQSHLANHPGAVHFTEDIRDFAVVLQLKKLVEQTRLKDPNAIIAIWASLECTNFSKAKGGLPRDADSRTLADHMYMYLEQIKPEYFWVENVREFMGWGPLCENGRPISAKSGRDYLKWVERIKAYGFRFDFKVLNAADFGAYQSRERLFLQFAASNYPISWPEQTHAKQPKQKGGMFPIQKWRPVREVLDLEDEGLSIFNRKKSLSENTLKRIHAGLIKFVANGDDVFTKHYNGGKVNPQHKVNSLDKPMGTICTNGTHALVKSCFIKKYFSGNPNHQVQEIDSLSGVITTIDHHALVTASHLNTYYGNGGIHSIDSPSPTITTKDRVAKVDVNFIDQQYGKSLPVSIENPSPSITTVPKVNLVSTKQYIYNPAWGGNNCCVDNPCCTVVARQDKAPLHIVSAQFGDLHFPIYADDSPTMVQIKEFMASHGIYDIKMRMLKIPELKQIQGFPKDYVLHGTQTEQKKYIGNAVEVNQAAAIVSHKLRVLQLCGQRV